jgi:hypothetical protein
MSTIDESARTWANQPDKPAVDVKKQEVNVSWLNVLIVGSAIFVWMCVVLSVLAMIGALSLASRLTSGHDGSPSSEQLFQDPNGNICFESEKSYAEGQYYCISKTEETPSNPFEGE